MGMQIYLIMSFPLARDYAILTPATFSSLVNPGFFYLLASHWQNFPAYKLPFAVTLIGSQTTVLDFLMQHKRELARYNPVPRTPVDIR